MKVDYLVVGSGLTGATIARTLADAGREVLVVDRRGGAGGNVRDHVHPSGIRVHTYGPHFFRTSSAKIWEFVQRFDQFYKHEARVQSLVHGRCENWPVAASYIQRVVGESWQPAFHGTPSNFEEASLAMMPRLIYEKFVKGYTEKQWGVPASSLSALLARRFEVRHDDEPRLMRHEHQGLPAHGYSHLMRGMLDGIPVVLNYDYLKRREDIAPRRCLIFSGPIDEFYDFRLGRLKYRCQRREHEYVPEADFLQTCAAVNNPDPDNGPYIRTLEWKRIMQPEYAARIRGTVLTRETAATADEPDAYEYPFPDEANARLYARYRELADETPKLLICGRLGEYRYYDMDHAIGHAMRHAEGLIRNY